MALNDGDPAEGDDPGGQHLKAAGNQGSVGRLPHGCLPDGPPGAIIVASERPSGVCPFGGADIREVRDVQRQEGDRWA